MAKKMLTLKFSNLALTVIVGISLNQDALRFLSSAVLKLNGSIINCLGADVSIYLDLGNGLVVCIADKSVLGQLRKEIDRAAK